MNPLPVVYIKDVLCFPREIEVYHTLNEKTTKPHAVDDITDVSCLYEETEISHRMDNKLDDRHVVCTSDISFFSQKTEKRHTTDTKNIEKQVPKLIKFINPADGSFQYYTYSPERHAYLATKQPSSTNSQETDYRCVVSRFQNFESDEETKEIFWTLFGTIVGFDSIPAVCVENVKGRKMVFVSFASEKHCNVIIDTFNDCPFMQVEKKKRH